ncbi:SHOCT domain-containing protein [Paracoccus hibiscisoli]|uniref:SHOCT domain-containing protein n=1 Tax=Paracoccus hibiscisoli TaxID=2023261 RepID=A0A4U0QUZ2_9RHOB|nr:SHOCT domain-containing protein [Paracoccus hibiscisoli]TJZ85826.1 SHOCT domain-containing protein [Paracoccus hibiscisoli]
MSKSNLNTAAEDDLRAMGLPAAFTMDDLRAAFDPAEIAAMSEGDDPLVTDLPEDLRAAGVKSKSAYDELNETAEEGDGDDGDDDPDGNGDADADEDDQDGDEGDDPDAEGDGEGDEDAGDQADDGADADAPGDQQPPKADTTPDPVLTLKDTAELETKVNTFDSKLEDLQALYDDGELTNAEFKAKLKELTTEQSKATVELERAQEANQRVQQEYAQSWYGKVASYTAARPELMDQTPIPGLPEGASAFKVFDNALRHVTSEAGREAFGHLTMAQKIDAAAKISNAYIEQTAGKPLKATDPKPKPKGDGKKAEKPGPRTDKRPDRVQTLGDVPAASDMDVQNSRFAALDSMDPMEAEDAIARMSKSEREKYLAGQ